MADKNDELYTELQEVKEEVNNISAKVDQILQMLSDFTIMLLDDSDEDESELDSDEEGYGYEDSWLPKEDDFWENEE